jgi:hypothetical protein
VLHHLVAIWMISRICWQVCSQFTYVYLNHVTVVRCAYFPWLLLAPGVGLGVQRGHNTLFKSSRSLFLYFFHRLSVLGITNCCAHLIVLFFALRYIIFTCSLVPKFCD